MENSRALTKEKRPRLGPEGPNWKDITIVFLIVALIIGFSWIAWFKFGWFH